MLTRWWAKLKSYHITDYDLPLIGMMLILSIFGLFAIASVAPGEEEKQLKGLILSVVLMLFISILDYSVILKLYWVFYVASALVLALVMTEYGRSAGGARRWISLFGIHFQPSEAAKILLILFFAQFIMKHRERIRSVTFVLLCLILAGPQIYLVYAQPDLSTTIMMAAIICTMLFVAGIDWRLVLTVLFVSVPAMVFIIYRVLTGEDTLLTTYQQKRILAWFHPEDYAMSDAYQTLNSMMAIGSGQLYGKGYNTNEISTVLGGGFVSETDTDFIFTVIGEEFGFVGGCIVILLVLLVAIECMVTAYRAKDMAGRLIAAGMGAWVGFQGLMNIGVTTGVMINTGLPLPFVSSGLTSLVCAYAGMGFVLNVRLQSRRA